MPESLKNIEAVSLAEAVTIAHDHHPDFGYRNNWFVDLGSRVVAFIYQDQEYISKIVGDIRKGEREVSNASRLARLVDGFECDEVTLRVTQPLLEHTLHDIPRHCVVSPYQGSDMSNEYYRDRVTHLTVDGYRKLMAMFVSRGIVYPALLPRNVIENDNVLALIDFEDVQFFSRRTKSDSLSRVTGTISWSYFFSKDDVGSVYELFEDNPANEPPTIGYERIFERYIGFNSTANELRSLVCEVVVAGEAARNNTLSLYRLDDISQLLGELFPRELEVLVDMSLAKLSDAEHGACSHSYGIIGRELHYQAMNGKKSAVTEFKNRCRALLWLTLSNRIIETITERPSHDLLAIIDTVVMPEDNMVQSAINTFLGERYGAKPDALLIAIVSRQLTAVD